MSSIEKLSIQGIRSFGSSAEDAQSLTFSSPVTLILGENGCGKTTIIECLKYALTGECPPGSDRGKSFIHDPKIFNLTDTLGQIKLQVRNVSGNRLSVCRSMKIVNRRGKYTFETLDSTMNYIKNEDGAPSNIADSFSKRCIDVDVAMCQFMGVSKAIINNVLFCHQEDSSWPLDEPKKLKEKFDAIFGITEYNKAIEKIIKMRKEEMEELKVKDSNLRLLAHLKQEMEGKTMSLQKAQEKCDTIHAKCNQCKSDVKPIEERLLEIRKIENEIGKFRAIRVEIETRLKNCCEQIVNLSKKIKILFNGDMHELELEIENFDRKMLQKNLECRKIENQLNELREEEKALQARQVEMDKKYCVLSQKYNHQNECNSKRAEKLRLLCNALQINVTVDLNDSNIIPNIIDKINEALSRHHTTLKETIILNDSLDQKRQAEIDNLRVNVTKLEEGIVLHRKQKESHKKEHDDLELKIKEVTQFTDRLQKLELVIQKNEQTYDNLKCKFNQDEYRQKISQKKDIIGNLQAKFQQIDKDLTVLNATAKYIAEIDLKNKEIDKKEQEVRRIKSRHSENLKKMFPHPIESNFRRALQEAYENTRREIKKLHEQANNQMLKQQSLEIERKNLKEKLSATEKLIEESNEKIFEKCHSSPYEELVAKARLTVEKHQLSHGALTSAKNMYKKYIQRIGEMPCCPLCHKNMSENEVSDLTAELSDEILRLPDTINRAEMLLKTEEAKYFDLLQLKPVIEKVSQMETELPQIKKRLYNIQENITSCLNEHESLQLLLAEPTTNLELINVMMGDMSILDEAIKETSRLKENVQNIKVKIPDGYGDKISIEDLQMEKVTVTAELDDARNKVEKDQQYYEKSVELLTKLREKRNSLKEEEFNLKEGVQSLPQLKARQQEVIHLLVSIDANIETSEIKLVSLQEELNEAIAQKAHQQKSDRKKVERLQEKLNTYKILDQDIKRLHKEMSEYELLNLRQEIAALKEQINKSKVNLLQKVNNITETSKEFDLIKEECLSHQTLERDLKENKELKILQQKEIELKLESEKLNKQLGDLDVHATLKERTELEEKRDQITVRKAELLGQVGEINNQIKKLKSEIEEPQFKESVLRYRRAHYEVEVSRRIIADLGQYRVALEWSLMQFHKEKMEKINRLIREYWRLIYRGNDIDYIQIQTDEMSTDSSADRKRNYNYRVIQSKNNTEIEMRGRCSAGQRVLGSLIIRMALAETFSSNCGVLALDEPTTNLDCRNIGSLCDALNRIVDERQAQSNFMLIIITHDEEFISTLGKINNYYRVFRNDDCKSVIRKVKIT